MRTTITAERFANLLAVVMLIVPIATTVPVAAAAPDDAEVNLAGAAGDVSKIVKQIRPSLATIRVNGRDGGDRGIGTGFVVSADGLVATNLHVIGQGRRFTIEMSDGRKLKPVAVHAFDKAVDLAVIRVEPGDRRLRALELAAPGELPQGTPVVAMGNPWGLQHSVVSGVVSAIREIEGQELLQVAMPIEPGNSGGPLVDMSGRVHGVINMKSAVKRNVAFAVQSDKLKVLLEKPNPVPIDRWATIGAIDEDQWSPLFGARWRQQAGRIIVSGSGQGFGGRSLCLATEAPPDLPFELGVFVKLDDESGAAGLVFHSDGRHKHYGFYPSNGKLRLSCFRGPTVYSWEVLRELPSEHYRPGEWNHLKVRVEKDKLLCYVNDELVIESNDSSYAAGQIGLAKFRRTEADFKDFRVDKELPLTRVSDCELAKIAEAIEPLPALENLRDEQLDKIAGNARAAVTLMDSRRAELEAKQLALQQQIDQLQRLAEDVRVRDITRRVSSLLEDGAAGPPSTEEADSDGGEKDVVASSEADARANEIRADDAEAEGASASDSGAEESGQRVSETPGTPAKRDLASRGVLLHAALLIAKLDERDIDLEGYLEQVEQMAAAIRDSLADDAGESDRIAALNRYLFKENGFHGSRFEYYHSANSYINRVIDDREGRPITLSVLYMELGRLLGLDIKGVALPGHFVVKWIPTDGEDVLIDVFDNGRKMTRDDAAKLVRDTTGQPMMDEYLQAAMTRAILSQMVLNLYQLAEDRADKEAMLRYIEARVAIEPEAFELRGMRAVLRAETGRRASAVADLDWIIDRAPTGVDLEQVGRMREFFLQQ